MSHVTAPLSIPSFPFIMSSFTICCAWYFRCKLWLISAQKFSELRAKMMNKKQNQRSIEDFISLFLIRLRFPKQVICYKNDMKISGRYEQYIANEGMNEWTLFPYPYSQASNMSYVVLQDHCVFRFRNKFRLQLQKGLVFFWRDCFRSLLHSWTFLGWVMPRPVLLRLTLVKMSLLADRTVDRLTTSITIWGYYQVYFLKSLGDNIRSSEK